MQLEVDTRFRTSFHWYRKLGAKIFCNAMGTDRTVYHPNRHYSEHPNCKKFFRKVLEQKKNNSNFNFSKNKWWFSYYPKYLLFSNKIEAGITKVIQLKSNIIKIFATSPCPIYDYRVPNFRIIDANFPCVLKRIFGNVPI